MWRLGVGKRRGCHLAGLATEHMAVEVVETRLGPKESVENVAITITVGTVLWVLYHALQVVTKHSTRCGGRGRGQGRQSGRGSVLVR